MANLFARAPFGVQLRGVTFSWTRGVLAITGSPQDGTSALLGVLAGRIKASGRFLVHGRAPEDVRQRIAYVPLDTVLPDALRVEEICDLASSLRKEPPKPARDRLAVLGLEALAKREGKSLSPAEARAVALTIALGSSADVLLIEEPLALLDPVAPSRVVEALRARGACTVVTTASVRDATRLADQLNVLTKGQLAPMSPVQAHLGVGGAILRIVVGDREAASALVAALTADSAVTSVDSGAYAKSSAIVLIAAGPDLVPLAAAVTRAVAAVGVPVETIEPVVMPLDAIRATLSAVRPPPPPPPLPPAPAPVVPPAPNTEPLLSEAT